MKKIITSIISIITSCLLILLVCLITISNTIFKKEYTIKILEKNNYPNKVYQSIKKEMENYIPQLHIGEEEISLDNIMTEELVKEDIYHLIESIYDNKKLQTNTEKIKKELDIKINEELNKYNRIPTSSEEKTIEEIKNNIINDYKSKVFISEKYITPIQKKYQIIKSIANKALILISLAYIMFISLLLIIRKKERAKWFSITTLTTSIILVSIPYLIIEKIKHILIINENLSEILIITMKDIFTKINTIGMILGIVSIITLIIGVEKVKKERT